MSGPRAEKSRQRKENKQSSPEQRLIISPNPRRGRDREKKTEEGSQREEKGRSLTENCGSGRHNLMETCHHLSIHNSELGVRIDRERVKRGGSARRGLETGVP